MAAPYRACALRAPVCAQLRNGLIFFMAQPPLLRKEGTDLARIAFRNLESSTVDQGQAPRKTTRRPSLRSRNLPCLVGKENGAIMADRMDESGPICDLSD